MSEKNLSEETERANRAEAEVAELRKELEEKAQDCRKHTDEAMNEIWELKDLLAAAEAKIKSLEADNERQDSWIKELETRESELER